MTFLYSISSTVSSFKIVFIILIGNFRPDNFLGGIFSCILAAHVNLALLVLCIGRCITMFTLLAVLLSFLFSLNVRVVPPLEVSQSCLLIQRRLVIVGLVLPLEVVGFFLLRWAPLEVSRG